MSNTIEQVASKGLGTVKQTKARLKRLTGIFEELSEEHGEVAALMLRIEKSGDPSVRKELFPIVKRDLLAHERAELEVLYASLREHGEARRIVVNHDRDATGVEMFVRELSEKNIETSEWALIFHNLTETVLRHAKEEEDEVFPEAQAILGRRVAEELLARYREARKGWLERISV